MMAVFPIQRSMKPSVMVAVESSPLCVVTKPLPARRTWHLSVLTTRSNTNWWAKYHCLWSVFEIYDKASSWIFLTANQLLPNGCANNMGLDTTYSRKLVIVNQLISSKLRNNVVANKSWMTVPYSYILVVWLKTLIVILF